MPKTYERPGGWEMMQPATSTDRIIGSAEDKRSTKTFISSERSSIILSLIKNHAENLLRSVRDLQQKEAYRALLREHHAKQPKAPVEPSREMLLVVLQLKHAAVQRQAALRLPPVKVPRWQRLRSRQAKEEPALAKMPSFEELRALYPNVTVPEPPGPSFAQLAAMYPAVKMPEPLSDELLKKQYPGVRAWLNLHQELVEHGASVQGFSLKVAARLAALEKDIEPRAESSIPSNDKAVTIVAGP